MKRKTHTGRIHVCLIACFPLLSWASSPIYYVHSDHLGTPQKLTDETAQVVWEAEYEPFGEATVDGDPDGDGNIIEFNLRFPGQYYDKYTGANYNYYRDYDPSTGRYLQSDPIGLLAQVTDPAMKAAGVRNVQAQKSLNHLYSYVSSSPVGNFDPLGLATTIITTYTNGFGSHAAVYVDAGGGALYDPAGSYPGEGAEECGCTKRGTGDLLGGNDISLPGYLAYHSGMGDSIRMQTFQTTPSQENQIISNAEARGGAAPFACASSVAGVINGVGPFSGLTGFYTPRGLADALDAQSKSR